MVKCLAVFVFWVDRGSAFRQSQHATGDPIVAFFSRRGEENNYFWARSFWPHQIQLDAEPILLPTVVKVWLALVPRVVIAVRQTTMIRASMTAYSTAVGPSSRARKLTMALVKFFMVGFLLCFVVNRFRVSDQVNGRANRCLDSNSAGRGADLAADGREGLIGVGAEGR